MPADVKTKVSALDLVAAASPLPTMGDDVTFYVRDGSQPLATQDRQIHKRDLLMALLQSGEEIDDASISLTNAQTAGIAGLVGGLRGIQIKAANIPGTLHATNFEAIWTSDPVESGRNALILLIGQIRSITNDRVEANFGAEHKLESEADSAYAYVLTSQGNSVNAGGNVVTAEDSTYDSRSVALFWYHSPTTNLDSKRVYRVLISGTVHQVDVGVIMLPLLQGSAP